MELPLWDSVSRPPTSALKLIKAGRLKGKSDINPQWRYKVLTEQFGICGFGWKYTIDKLWLEPGNAGEVFAFSQISLYVKQGDQWSEPIPGIGGHRLVEMETAGLHNNDEAFKMATTDALGVAAKMLGVAAEVYLGNFDGSKYLEPPEQPPKTNVKESFGNSAPKPFQWSKATSFARREYVLMRIGEAKAFADPVQGLNKLKEIMEALQTRSRDLVKEDLDAIATAALSAEQDLSHT